MNQRPPGLKANQRPQGLKAEKALTGFLQYKSAEGLAPVTVDGMVSAWAAENEHVLGQRKLDEKSNEITAIPELLKLLDLSGCIVTIDAIGSQTNIAKTNVEG